MLLKRIACQRIACVEMNRYALWSLTKHTKQSISVLISCFLPINYRWPPVMIDKKNIPRYVSTENIIRLKRLLRPSPKITWHSMRDLCLFRSCALKAACQSPPKYQLIDWLASMDLININYVIRGACQGGNFKIIKRFLVLVKCNDLEYACEEGFFGACIGGHLNIVKWMLRLNKKSKFYFHNEGGLYLAVHNNHFQIVQHLIEKGFCDFRLSDRICYSAGYYGDLKMIAYLIQKDKNGQSSLLRILVGAFRANRPKIIKYFIDIGLYDFGYVFSRICEVSRHTDQSQGAFLHLIELGVTRCDYCHRLAEEHLIS